MPITFVQIVEISICTYTSLYFFPKLNKNRHLISLQLKKEIAECNQHIFSLDRNYKYSQQRIVLYFWSYSCLSLSFQKEASPKQTAANGTCPVQMPPALKEHWLPPHLAPLVVQIRRERAESQHAQVPLLLQEAVWDKSPPASAFRSSLNDPSHRQRASLQPEIVLHARTLQSSFCCSP